MLPTAKITVTLSGDALSGEFYVAQNYSTNNSSLSPDEKFCIMKVIEVFSWWKSEPERETSYLDTLWLQWNLSKADTLGANILSALDRCPF